MSVSRSIGNPWGNGRACIDTRYNVYESGGHHDRSALEPLAKVTDPSVSKESTTCIGFRHWLSNNVTMQTVVIYSSFSECSLYVDILSHGHSLQPASMTSAALRPPRQHLHHVRIVAERHPNAHSQQRGEVPFFICCWLNEHRRLYSVTH